MPSEQPPILPLEPWEQTTVNKAASDMEIHFSFASTSGTNRIDGCQAGAIKLHEAEKYRGFHLYAATALDLDDMAIVDSLESDQIAAVLGVAQWSCRRVIENRVKDDDSVPGKFILPLQDAIYSVGGLSRLIFSVCAQAEVWGNRLRGDLLQGEQTLSESGKAYQESEDNPRGEIFCLVMSIRKKLRDV